MLRRTLALTVLAAATALVSACGDSRPPIGPTPTPNPPQIACPSSIVIENIVGSEQPVTYAPPTATEGSEPVSVACTPASGASFPLGSTTVTCTATDALARQASCSFGVTVRHRLVALTRYLAFGDSMTEGQNGRDSITFAADGGPIRITPFIDTENAYPTFLQRMFSQRIPSQPITVINAGKGGESVADNDSRLKGEIARHRAEVLLLLQGINDLNGGASPNSVVNALRDNIRTAKDRGVQYVFISTLLPVAPGNCISPPTPPCRGVFTNNTVISATNQGIRAMVPANGAFLVDPYDLFFANRETFIDIDGLHLRPAGNQALATAFLDRILQVIPAPQLFGQ